MKFKGFIVTDLSRLQFRSEVSDSVGTWTFKEFKAVEHHSIFTVLIDCSKEDLELMLESLWDNKKLWIEENLNLNNFGANQVSEAIVPYDYDMQRKVGNIYSEDLPDDKTDFLSYIKVKKQIFYQPVDIEGKPLSEELILKCIFQQYFI